MFYFKFIGHPDQSTWLQLTCSRANLRAVGWDDKDMGKPIITIAAPYSNAMPCNYHFNELAEMMAAEVEKQGGKPFICYPLVISDGETQGTYGMKYSLISRDYIADTIEIMHEGILSSFSELLFLYLFIIFLQSVLNF